MSKDYTRYWTTEQLNWMRDRNLQRAWCIKVSYGILDRYLVGPYRYGGTYTGDRYLFLLKNILTGLLENDPLHIRRNLIIQQLPHNSLAVGNQLKANYPRRFIGTKGPTPWPLRIPDIAPLDFFLWNN